MLSFSQEQMAALGEGVLIPDGDTVYITNCEWLLVVTGCEHHIPMGVLKLIAFAEAGQLVDWRVLGAKEIFVEDKKFLPARGSRSLDIYVNAFKYTRVTPDTIRGLLDKNTDALWGSCYRLDQLFHAGEAHTKYLRPVENEKRKFASEPAAEHYIFNLDNRITVVNASYFRVFFEMNFEINCPTRSSGRPGVYGLYKRDASPDIFGYLAPVSDSGIRKTKDGRDLFLDASDVSWYSPEEGLAHLQAWGNYTPGVEIFPTKTIKQNAGNDLLLGVAILRWHDVSDADIDVLYAEGRDIGLRLRADFLLAAVEQALKDISETGSTWQAENVIKHFEEDVDVLEDELHIKISREEYEDLKSTYTAMKQRKKPA